MNRPAFFVLVGACSISALALSVVDAIHEDAIASQLSQIHGSVSGLVTSAASTASTTATLATTVRQLATRPAETVAPASQASQDQLLTAAVAKTAPAVVSVVISKDVPNLQITYVNPFGDNPSFQGFGFQIPVYEQKGSSLQEVGAGTGFLISHDGYILTNRHVVSDASAEYTVLLSDGSQKPATVVYRDTANDVAVIKIAGSYPTVASLGSSASLKLGQTVVAIGNALGQYNNSVSVGIVSGINRTVEAYDDNGNAETLSGVIQTDASINPGNSGGPLMDLTGDVVGVNVATVSGGTNISFALPVDTVKNIVHTYAGL